MRNRDEPPDPQAQSRFAALLDPQSFSEPTSFSEPAPVSSARSVATPRSGPARRSVTAAGSVAAGRSVAAAGSVAAPRSVAAARSVAASVDGPRATAASLALLNPGRRAVKPLIGVAVAVAAIAGYLAWRAQPTSQPIPPPVVASSAPAPVGIAASSSPVLVVVAVEGRVHHPGLVRLVSGARVADAIDAAGGVLPGTDLSFVNLAQKVTDGQLIVIGKTGPAGGAPAPGPTSGTGSGSGLVDLNTATAADLDTLPGIGPSLATHIIDYRTAHGGFHSVDELRSVSGIGDAKFAEIKDLVTV